MMLGRYRHLACCVAFGIIVGIVLERSWSRFQYRSYETSLSGAQFSKRPPTVTCLVIVRSGHYRMLNAAKETWLKKCDHYTIVRPDKQRKIPNMYKNDQECQHPADVYSINAKSGWDFLCTSLFLLPRNFEWLLIVPDSLIVIMENLKHVINDRDWRNEYYMGHPVQHYNGAYNILSAGILLSNATMKRLLERFPNKAACRVSGKHWNNEDVYLGMYLTQLGVPVEDTRDTKGRTRFNGYNANTLLFPGKLYRQTDYYKKALYPSKDETQCCSEQLVTIDSSDSDHMFLHYFLMDSFFERATIKTSVKETTENEPQWIQALKDIGYTGPTHNISSEQYYRIWEKHISPEKLMEKFKDVAAVHD